MEPIIAPANQHDLNRISEQQARDFLHACEEAYLGIVRDPEGLSKGSLIMATMVQLRTEMRYWEDYLTANFGGEQAKRPKSEKRENG